MNKHLTDAIQQKAQQFLDWCRGILYERGKKWGKDIKIKPPNIDCSGLVVATFRAIGLKIVDGSANQFAESLIIGREEIDTCDLAFYRNEKKVINHVAIVYDNDYVVEASGSKGGVVKTLISEFIQGRKTPAGDHKFAGFRRPIIISLNTEIRQ